mmetsp:Transcript_17535/g.48854  ORF Transcript_17535/g.48854 Transcript_17535/m.48854 type:complete len:114 (-) Transcript_17535:3122-3463(-)
MQSFAARVSTAAAQVGKQDQQRPSKSHGCTEWVTPYTCPRKVGPQHKGDVGPQHKGKTGSDWPVLIFDDELEAAAWLAGCSGVLVSWMMSWRGYMVTYLSCPGPVGAAAGHRL